MYGSNNMKKSVVFNNQFTPKLGGQFELESGGQFAPELVVNLHWKVVVNLTGFSNERRVQSKIHVICDSSHSEQAKHPFYLCPNRLPHQPHSTPST